MPLFEAGFVQRIIPTSNKKECDFNKAMICKQEGCDKNAAWCKLNYLLFFNYTSIYSFPN